MGRAAPSAGFAGLRLMAAVMIDAIPRLSQRRARPVVAHATWPASRRAGSPRASGVLSRARPSARCSTSTRTACATSSRTSACAASKTEDPQAPQPRLDGTASEGRASADAPPRREGRMPPSMSRAILRGRVAGEGRSRPRPAEQAAARSTEQPGETIRLAEQPTRRPSSTTGGQPTRSRASSRPRVVGVRDARESTSRVIACRTGMRAGQRCSSSGERVIADDSAAWNRSRWDTIPTSAPSGPPAGGMRSMRISPFSESRGAPPHRPSPRLVCIRSRTLILVLLPRLVRHRRPRAKFGTGAASASALKSGFRRPRRRAILPAVATAQGARRPEEDVDVRRWFCATCATCGAT